MKKITVALAAASLLAAPAALAQNSDGKGNAHGRGPKVCLVTFGSTATSSIGPTGYNGPEVYPGGARLDASGGSTFRAR